MWKLIFPVSLFVFSGCASDYSAVSNLAKAKGPRYLTVTVDRSDACTPKVTVPSSGCDADPGDTQDICAVPRQKIRWILDGEPDGTEMHIDFSSEKDPFSWYCNAKNKNSIVKCTIKRSAAPDDYKYSVKVETCENSLDPRIWVN